MATVSDRFSLNAPQIGHQYGIAASSGFIGPGRSLPLTNSVSRT
jgi:hypothetical protein